MASSVAVGIVLAFLAVTAAIYFFREPKGLATTATGAKGAPAEPDATPKATPHTAASAVTEPAALANASSSEVEVPSASAALPVMSSTAARPAALEETDPLGLVKEPVAAATPVTNPLTKFDRLIGGANDDPLAKPTESSVGSAALPVPALAKPLAPRPPPREIDVAKRLADPLPAIETTDTPLADFVQLMSDLSTIPITLELPFLPATAESAVAFQSTKTTVGKALTDGLATMGLAFVVSNDQLIVRRAEPVQITPTSRDVKDLTRGDEQQMTDLAELIKAVVDPGSWSDEQGGGSITVDAGKGALVVLNRRAVQVQVLLALEKLRASRTPPLAHQWKLDPKVFQLDSRSAQAKARLDTLVSLNYRQPTRLLTILDWLGQAAGARILVDWHDVASAGWNPAAEASLVVDKQPLGPALDALLAPLDLTWRIIDAQTLQVLTPQRLAEQGELEFYKVAELLTGDTIGEALLARVRVALGDGTFREGGGNGEIRYDDKGKCLLAWLPQPKQRELEALLGKWRNAQAE
jgi:hypothetical protein